MATALTDGQAELRADSDAALVIGDGTNYAWADDGPQWWASPAVRTTDQDRTNTDGVTPGRDLLGSHVTTLQVLLLGDSASDVGDRIDTWKAACARASDELVTVRLCALGRTRRRYGRFRIVGDVDAHEARTGWMAIGACQFEALDPRTYGDDEHTASTPRVQPGSGFSVPFTPPFSLGAAVGGTINATNDGNTAGPWTARLDGPLTYPEISHLESGRRLSLDLTANGGVTLGTGEWLDFDSQSRSILLNGTTDRRTQLTIDSDWWSLLPGANTFTLAADDGTGELTVSWRDTYLS